MKYTCACFPRQLLVIENSILKQLIIHECHMGVYYKDGSNEHSRTSIFDVSHDYVKKVVPERKLADVIFLKLILTSYRSRAVVRINFHQQLHPQPHYALNIPDVVIGSIYGLTLSKVYF